MAEYPICKNCGEDNDCDAGIYCFRCAMIKITSGKLPEKGGNMNKYCTKCREWVMAMIRIGEPRKTPYGMTRQELICPVCGEEVSA